MWWLSGLASAHIPVFIYTGPDQDWCGAYASALQGDIVLLEPGDYTGPCDLTGKEPDPAYPSEFTQLAARDLNYRPRFHSDGMSPYILSMTGEQAQVAYLDFPDVPAGVTAIEVRDTRLFWLLDLTFSGVAGTAVQTFGTADNFRIEQLAVHGVGGTGFALGCPGCATTSLVVHDVLLQGLTTGIQVDGDGSLAEIISDGGTALDLTGDLLVEESAVRGDIVLRSPVTLQSNIVVGTLTAAAGASGAKLYGNTLYRAEGSPLVLDDWGAGSVLQNNAISDAIPTEVGASGNVACTADECWRNAAISDFYPRGSGHLPDGSVPPDPGTQFADWCGYARQSPVTVGGLELLGEPIAPIRFDVAKTFGSCSAVAETTGTPATEGPGDTAASDPISAGDRTGCGCAARPGPAPLSGLLTALLVLVWRFRGRSR